LTRPIRVAHGLVRAVSAFLSTLAAGPMVGKERDQEIARGRGPSPHRPGIENRCPVCQARFRGARFCSRCGADLEPLMRLTVKAWQLRQAARQALEAGDVERALGLAMEAQGVQGTGSGEALRLLGAWLTTV
jgi:hypothetical protein